MNPKNAKAYYYRANAFYDSGQYNSRAWADVHAAEALGYRITPSFVRVLSGVSGRERQAQAARESEAQSQKSGL